MFFPHNNLFKPYSSLFLNMAEETINFETWAQLDLRVAKIKKAEDIPDKDKLYKLEIDLGKEKRTIVAGIKQYYTKEELKDKRIIVIANLEPAKLAGIKSNGMLLAAVTDNHKKVVLIQPEKDIEIGSKIQ